MEDHKEKILDIYVDTRDKGDILEELSLAIKGRMRRVVACINPNAAVIGRTDALFREAMRSSDIIIPDGIGVVIASRISGGRIRERIAGGGLIDDLSAYLNKRGGATYFFYGSTTETLGKIKNRMGSAFPDIGIAGLCAPPFGELTEAENEEHVRMINLANPDVLWVGMTAPRQEKWIYRNRDKLKAPVIAAVGAAFDFCAGTRKRGPVLMQRLGLEWLFRFLGEPKRLWRRNVVSAPIFIFYIIKDRLFGRRQA